MKARDYPPRLKSITGARFGSGALRKASELRVFRESESSTDVRLHPLFCGGMPGGIGEQGDFIDL